MVNQRSILKFDKTPFIEFFSSDSNVVFASIFGSSANGDIMQGSDVDIAVLFHEPPKGIEKFEYYSKLSDVNRNIERIDLVILNEADVVLSFEALKGEILCKNDIDKTAEYFSLTSRLYESQMASYERQAKYRRELIL